MAGKKKVTRQSHGGAVQIKRLLADIRGRILSARRVVVRSVDTLQVLTSFEIGCRMVEHEQHGTSRAAYGKLVVEELAKRLPTEFGEGFLFEARQKRFTLPGSTGCTCRQKKNCGVSSSSGPRTRRKDCDIGWALHSSRKAARVPYREPPVAFD